MPIPSGYSVSVGISTVQTSAAGFVANVYYVANQPISSFSFKVVDVIEQEAIIIERVSVTSLEIPDNSFVVQVMQCDVM